MRQGCPDLIWKMREVILEAFTVLSYDTMGKTEQDIGNDVKAEREWHL